MDFVTSTTAEWLLEISGLTVGHDHEDPQAQGLALAAQVRDAAATYRVHNPCTGASACSGACPLGSLDGGHAACHLAEVLAGSALPSTEVTPDRAAQLYVQALRAASTAVFRCRRHAHPTGECWFEVDGVPRCGDVLAATHRLGG